MYSENIFFFAQVRSTKSAYSIMWASPPVDSLTHTHKHTKTKKLRLRCTLTSNEISPKACILKNIFSIKRKHDIFNIHRQQHENTSEWAVCGANTRMQVPIGPLQNAKMIPRASVVFGLNRVIPCIQHWTPDLSRQNVISRISSHL